MDELANYQTENLILLMGTNPLPNYVAAQLLLKPNGMLLLVHSRKVEPVADRLANHFRASFSIKKIEVPEAEGSTIFERVDKAVSKITGSIGFNYTGGTKCMAVHAYRVVHECFGKYAIYSYLDARTLEMVFDREGQNSIHFPVGRLLEPGLRNLLTLHGYDYKKVKDVPCLPSSTPTLPDKASQIKDLFTGAYRLGGVRGFKQFYDDWRDWLDSELKMKQDFPSYEKRYKKDPLGFESTRLFQGSTWDGCTTIGALAANWGLHPVALAEWLDGKWLEHYTVAEAQQVQAECHIQELLMNIEAEFQATGSSQIQRGFELDIAGLRGYQLFVISCTSGYRKGEVKTKLFEAFFRARQIGGEEARVALLCCALPMDRSENRDSYPALIQSEIREEWDAHDQVQVFGLEHLDNLRNYLKEWFERP